MSVHGPPPLPVGWEARWEPNYNQYYFVDMQTGQSQWEMPGGATAPPPAAPQTHTAATPPPAPPATKDAGTTGKKHGLFGKVMSKVAEKAKQKSAAKSTGHGGAGLRRKKEKHRFVEAEHHEEGHHIGEEDHGSTSSSSSESGSGSDSESGSGSDSEGSDDDDDGDFDDDGSE